MIKFIHSVLSNSVLLKEILQDKIYPLKAPEEIQAPYIIFKVDRQNREHNKGLSFTAYQDLDIMIVSHTLEECYKIANEIDTTLSRFSGKFEGVNISDIYLNDFETNYEEQKERYRIVQEFTLILHTQN